MGVLRLIGLALSLAALAWLMFLGYALYTRTLYGLSALVELGMPAALFGALAAGVSVCVGLWLAVRSRSVHPAPKADPSQVRPWSGGA
jgi:hypothetical protein